MREMLTRDYHFHLFKKRSQEWITCQALQRLFKLPASHYCLHGMNTDMLLQLFFKGTQQQNIVCHELVKFFVVRHLTIPKHGVLSHHILRLRQLRVDPRQLVHRRGYPQARHVRRQQLLVQRMPQYIRLAFSSLPILPAPSAAATAVAVQELLLATTTVVVITVTLMNIIVTASDGGVVQPSRAGGGRLVNLKGHLVSKMILKSHEFSDKRSSTTTTTTSYDRKL
uniref:Homeobox protein knotted-1-like 3 isoform X2 n=1 Tax=Rhizophora mucronata TaxID=61149 RepID=A0A2P2K117_RHIMU